MSIKRNAVSAVLLSFALLANVSNAQGKPAVWTAKEQWRIDGSEAGEPFAALRDFIVLNDGQVWTLDFKDQDIRRYSGSGKFLGKSGRKGSGPGEMQNANGMLVAHDGKVWVNDPANGRYTVFKSDGKFDSQSLHPFRSFGYRWDGFRNNVTGEILESVSEDGVRSLRRFDKTGKELGPARMPNCSGNTPLDIYYRAETPKVGSTNGSYPFTRGGGLVSNGQGNFWCAAARGNRVVLISGARGDTLATAALPYPLMRVTSEERADALANVEKILAKHTTNNFDRSKIPADKPGIVTLFADGDGRLWVQRENEYGKRATKLDAFDAKGKHLGSLTIPAKLTAGMPLHARGSLVWLSIVDQDDVPCVVQYRLQ